MILSSHQPNFAPYMGLFYKAYRSDVMVFSTDVLFSKQGRHNYNYVNSPKGKRKITLPVSAHQDTLVADAMYVDLEYNLNKIAKGLLQEYKKAPHYEEGCKLLDAMKSIAIESNGNMAKFNSEVTKYICSKFGMKTKFIDAQSLDLKGHKDERIVQMCEKTGASVYMSGDGAVAYHIPEMFDKKNIELKYVGYSPVVYSQVHGEFEENLSVIDYIFNQGFNLPKEWVK